MWFFHGDIDPSEVTKPSRLYVFFVFGVIGLMCVGVVISTVLLFVR